MGASFGVVFKTAKGEEMINKVVDIEVPPTVKGAVTKAVKAAKGAAKEAAGKTVTGAKKGAKVVKEQVKQQQSNAAKTIGAITTLDLQSMDEGHRQMLIDRLKEKAGKSDLDKPPPVAGHSAWGTTASNSDINSALKQVGIYGLLPTEGETGAFLYFDSKTNKLSGFAVTIKIWQK